MPNPFFRKPWSIYRAGIRKGSGNAHRIREGKLAHLIRTGRKYGVSVAIVPDTDSAELHELLSNADSIEGSFPSMNASRRRLRSRGVRKHKQSEKYNYVV